MAWRAVHRQVGLVQGYEWSIRVVTSALIVGLVRFAGGVRLEYVHTALGTGYPDTERSMSKRDGFTAEFAPRVAALQAELLANPGRRLFLRLHHVPSEDFVAALHPLLRTVDFIADVGVPKSSFDFDEAEWGHCTQVSFTRRYGQNRVDQIGLAIVQRKLYMIENPTGPVANVFASRRDVVTELHVTGRMMDAFRLLPRLPNVRLLELTDTTLEAFDGGFMVQVLSRHPTPIVLRFHKITPSNAVTVRRLIMEELQDSNVTGVVFEQEFEAMPGAERAYPSVAEELWALSWPVPATHPLPAGVRPTAAAEAWRRARTRALVGAAPRPAHALFHVLTRRDLDNPHPPSILRDVLQADGNGQLAMIIARFLS